MGFRCPIPSPRQRSTRLDHRWSRLSGEWEPFIDYESPLEAWSSIGSDLLGSTPCLDNVVDAFKPYTHDRHDLP